MVTFHDQMSTLHLCFDGSRKTFTLVEPLWECECIWNFYMIMTHPIWIQSMHTMNKLLYPSLTRLIYEIAATTWIFVELICPKTVILLGFFRKELEEIEPLHYRPCFSFPSKWHPALFCVTQVLLWTKKSGFSNTKRKSARSSHTIMVHF